jgi:menaquinone-9 beta-reductase
MPKCNEILVVGAGPGGCVAAIGLARAGFAVKLVEAVRFPRDKVCGECVSAMGLAGLNRMGVLAALEVTEPAKLIRTTLIGPDGRASTRPLGAEMWGVTRRRLDEVLLGQAREAGVRVVQPGRVEKIDKNRATIRTAEGVEEVGFDWAVVGDGSSGLLGGRPRPSGDLGVKLHLRGVRADAGSIHLFTLAGSYGGLAKVEGDLWNVAVSVPAEVVKRCRGDLEEVWRGVVGASGFLREAVAGAERVGEILAAPLPRFGVRPSWPAGVIPVGNAAAALEPIGGEGMGLAIRSAELAVEAIVAAGGGEVDVERLRARYRKLWRTRRAACRAAAMALSQPRLAPVMIRVSRACPPLTRAVLRLMGKESLA